MPSDPVIVTELVTAYTDDIPGLVALRAQVLDAYIGRHTTLIHINQRGRDGSNSAGISLTDAGQQRDFLEACQEAHRALTGDTSVPANTLSNSASFGYSYVQV